jgi:GTP-binding protein
VVADIPGLIEGASEGVGLGHEFLRHVERCRFLIHIVDITQENPIENYKKINEELQKHSERLSNLYQVVVLNKIDVLDEETRQDFYTKFKDFADDIFLISAATQEGLTPFMDLVMRKVDEIPKPEFHIDIDEDLAAYDNDDSAYSIYKADKNTFVIEGGKIIRLANVTDTRNIDQLYRFQNIMSSMNVYEALKEAGIKEGDLVKVGHIEFEYFD